VSKIDGLHVDDNSGDQQTTVCMGDDIAVQRSPAFEYQKHILACRADQFAVGMATPAGVTGALDPPAGKPEQGRI
jgi:hypothetical protein